MPSCAPSHHHPTALGPARPCRTAGELPRGERRRRLVAVALDSDFALPQVTAAVGELLRQLEAAGLRDDVGVGMLSMLGFESTCSCMQVRRWLGGGGPATGRSGR